METLEGAWVERCKYTHRHSALAYLPPIKYGGESLRVLPKMGQNGGGLQGDTPLPWERLYLFLTPFLPVRNSSQL